MAEDKTDFKIHILYERDGEDLRLWVLRVRSALNGNDFLKAITEKQVDAKIDQKAFALMIPPVGDNPRRGVQQCELAKDMWDRLQEGYVRRAFINELTLILHLFNMGYEQNQNMESFIAILESQFARLVSTDTKLDG